MALTFVSGGKVATMEIINDFADSMFERLPQQYYAMVLFVVCCALGLVGVVRSRERSALLKQLDKLNREVRRLVRELEMAESRRFIGLRNPSSRQQDATSIVPGKEIDGSDDIT
jgi:hypothetical protein